LGPRSRREAKTPAVQLATLCQTICSFAADSWKGIAMDASQIDDKQNDLAQHTVAACQNAITRALENPAQAIGLARGSSGAEHAAARRREVERGEAGIAAVTASAEAYDALRADDVLKLASVAEEALAALAAVEHVAPSIAPAPAQPPAPRRPQPPAACRSSARSRRPISTCATTRDRDHPTFQA
jgi:hypothetical protein